MINFNKMTVENFNQWPLSLRYVVLILLALLFGIVCCWFILKSDFYHYKKLVQEEKNLQREFEEKRQRANLPAYQQQVANLQKNYRDKLQQLAGKDEIYNLLNEMSKTAIESGLVVELLAPKAAEKRDFLMELAVDMTMIGKYQQLVSFLSKVRQFNYLISFHNLVITKDFISQEKISTEVKSDKFLRMEIRAKIYQLSGNN